jgi:hypothetical protein
MVLNIPKASLFSLHKTLFFGEKNEFVKSPTLIKINIFIVKVIYYLLLPCILKRGGLYEHDFP